MKFVQLLETKLKLKTKKETGNQQGFLKDLNSKGQKSPFGLGWFFQVSDGVVQVDGNFWNDQFNFNILTQEEGRGKGYATAVLKLLTSLADKHGVTLSLTAEPFGREKAMNKTQLRKWYMKHGFKFGKYMDGGMNFVAERKPKH